jgi:UDP:flavonoid glycosyltransferase YjiC (YdhE family)
LEKISPERGKKKETVFPTRTTMNSQTSQTVKIIFKAFPDIKVQQIMSKHHRGPKRTTRDAKKTQVEQRRTLAGTKNQS